MSRQSFLVAKAIRTNEELTNRELDRRMRTPVKQVAGVASMAVPGGGEIASLWEAERKFRVRRNANKAQARSLQRSEQRQRMAAAATGLGLGVAGAGVGPVKHAVKTRSVRSAPKVAAGAMLAAGGAGAGYGEAKRKRKVESKIWTRMLERNPGGRS